MDCIHRLQSGTAGWILALHITCPALVTGGINNVYTSSFCDHANAYLPGHQWSMVQDCLCYTAVGGSQQVWAACRVVYTAAASHPVPSDHEMLP